MTFIPRVLPPVPIASLENYLQNGGGDGLDAARQVSAEVIIGELAAAGLRGRGGAGFPTAVKWQTVVDNVSDVLRTTVVVNAAEGEPGTYKDRAILVANPYTVLEGALIAAHVVGAANVIVATKRSFADVIDRLRSAIAEIDAAGWLEGVDLEVFEGPDEYLYGEETALLEVLDGRQPFPRIAPPYRRGQVEVVDDPDGKGNYSGSAARVEMAGPGGVAPPTLVNNVETFANVPGIVAKGASWFREEGTDESPGTLVVTVSGSTLRHGVAEVAMGTTLRDAINSVGDGVAQGRDIAAVLVGSASSVLGSEHLDTPLSYEAFEGIGSSLGSAGFVVYDDTVDLVPVAAGVSRFLAVESCGQCTPCKGDGLVMAEILARMAASESSEHDMNELTSRIGTVTDEARCYLAQQQQNVIGSLVERFPEHFADHLSRDAMAVEPALFAEYSAIVDGTAVVEPSAAAKQPDWTHDEKWSGKWPAEIHTNQRPDGA